MNKFSARATRSLAAVALVFAGAMSGFASQASAQALSYTDGQAAAGASTYRARCETCHGDTLQGLLEAPALTGREFAKWRGKPVKDLFEFIATYMPQDEPAKLSKEQYADVLAYMLKFNNVAAGATPLLPDMAAAILIPAP